MEGAASRVCRGMKGAASGMLGWDWGIAGRSIGAHKQQVLWSFQTTVYPLESRSCCGCSCNHFGPGGELCACCSHLGSNDGCEPIYLAWCKVIELCSLRLQAGPPHLCVVGVATPHSFLGVLFCAWLQDMIVSKLRTIPGVKLAEPEGAFYVLPEMSAFFGPGEYCS